MGETSAISWTEATWNTIVGCSKVSEGCHNCYAESLALRYGWSKNPWAERFAEENVVLKPKKLTLPLTPKWTAPKRIFVNSLSDVFHPLVPFEYVEAMWGVMALSPQHTFQILTKRPERMLDFMNQLTTEKIKAGMVRALKPDLLDTGSNNVIDQLPERYRATARAIPDTVLPNVWLGTSIENSRWTHRAKTLAQVPAAVRFISAEPLIGSLFESDEDKRAPLDLTGIDWVIVGAESGKGRRPYDMAWSRDIRDACVANGTAFFYKQSDAFRSGHHPYLTEEDGTCWEWHQDPGVLTPPSMVHDVTGCEDAGQRQEAMAL